jgi:predicted transcriptional regulator
LAPTVPDHSPDVEPTDPTQARAQILARRDLAVAEIRAKRVQIQKRIDALNRLSTQRDLSEAEEKEFDQLDDAMVALAEAESELQREVLVALDRSAARALADRLDAINEELKKKIEQVQRVARQVKKLADLFKQIDGVIQSLTKLAALLA